MLTTVTLAENQYFELVFWQPGEDPMGPSFSPVGAGKESSYTVDLDKASEILSALLISGREYEWGVLLVELNPYHRLRYLGGGHRFLFQHTGGGGGSSGGGPAPTATPR